MIFNPKHSSFKYRTTFCKRKNLHKPENNPYGNKGSPYAYLDFAVVLICPSDLNFSPFMKNYHRESLQMFYCRKNCSN